VYTGCCGRIIVRCYCRAAAVSDDQTFQFNLNTYLTSGYDFGLLKKLGLLIPYSASCELFAKYMERSEEEIVEKVQDYMLFAQFIDHTLI
jgi:hypothetical protein